MGSSFPISLLGSILLGAAFCVIALVNLFIAVFTLRAPRLIPFKKEKRITALSAFILVAADTFFWGVMACHDIRSLAHLQLWQIGLIVGGIASIYAILFYCIPFLAFKKPVKASTYVARNLFHACLCGFIISIISGKFFMLTLIIAEIHATAAAILYSLIRFSFFKKLETDN